MSKMNYIYNTLSFTNRLICMGSKCTLVQWQVFTSRA